MAQYFVGITGASGHVYARALLAALVELGHGVDLALTGAGQKVLRHELGIESGPSGVLDERTLDAWIGPGASDRIRSHALDAVEAPPSSGTHLSGGAVIVPCSMGSLARISVGLSSNLVERVADVSIKEGRTLVLVPREAPLSEIHLENLLRLARLGAAIVPASPGFYHLPKSIDDLVGHVVSKVLDRLGVERGGAVRWKGLEPDETDPGLEGAQRP